MEGNWKSLKGYLKDEDKPVLKDYPYRPEYQELPNLYEEGEAIEAATPTEATPFEKIKQAAHILRAGMSPYTPISSKEEADSLKDSLNFGPENIDQASYLGLLKKSARSSKKHLPELFPDKYKEFNQRVDKVVEGGNRGTRKNLANEISEFVPPEVQKKALHKISGRTNVRINPETGEREFKLFRGFTGSSPTSPDGVTESVLSFTPNPKVADRFGVLHESWVPESKILHSVRENRKPGWSLAQEEDEIFVAPGVKKQPVPYQDQEKLLQPNKKSDLQYKREVNREEFRKKVENDLVNKFEPEKFSKLREMMKDPEAYGNPEFHTLLNSAPDFELQSYSHDLKGLLNRFSPEDVMKTYKDLGSPTSKDDMAMFVKYLDSKKSKIEDPFKINTRRHIEDPDKAFGSTTTPSLVKAYPQIEGDPLSPFIAPEHLPPKNQQQFSDLIKKVLDKKDQFFNKSKQDF